MAKNLRPEALLIPVKLLPKLGRDAALLLAYLVWYEAQGTVPKDEAKWFVCRQNEIRRDLGYSVSMQTRLMRRLDEMWCIETTRFGFPSVRHIRLLNRLGAVKVMRQFQLERIPRERAKVSSAGLHCR